MKTHVFAVSFLICSAFCAVNVYLAVNGQHPAVNAAVAVFCGLGALFQLALIASSR